MLTGLPPSGPWKGYYLYGHAGVRHGMRLHLTFTPDGSVEGEGVDDIGRFVIDGIFDPRTSGASWVKAYIGMHTVQYSGLYCANTVCGDWMLYGATGGFWIWPATIEDNEFAGAADNLEQEVEISAATPSSARP